MKRLITLFSFCFLFITYAKAQYCVPTITQCFEHITNLTLNTINHTSADACGSTTTAYSDFTATSTTLTVGQTYTVTVTLNGQYEADTVDLWIDYDHNLAYDNSEYVGKIFGFTQGANPVVTQSATFVVSLGATTGNTRLRARVRDGQSNATPSPCNLQNYGEAEDYTVNISSGAPLCNGTPQALTITNSSPVYACPSSSVTLTATDPNTGVSGITYQWQQSASVSGPWSNITTGGTGLSYTTQTVVSTLYYRAAALCNATSSTSLPSNIITVSPAVAAAIIANPAPETVCAGTSTLFAVSANGTLPVYQWQVNDGTGFANITDNATYTGSATTILNVNTSASMSGYSYRCVVTANGCTPAATSAAAILTVRSAPAITVQPASPRVCPGTNTQFSVTASGTPTLTYQWQLHVGTTYSNITNNATYSGATTATLSVNNVTSSMDGNNYKCIVSGPCTPSVTSAVAVLSIGLVPPSITASGNTTICSGDNVYLTTPTISGYTYQWHSGSNLLPGATNPVYEATAQGVYYVVASLNGNCTGASPSILITVNPSPTQPSISALGNITFCIGSGVLLMSDVTSGLATQWLLNDGTILGANNTFYNATDSGSFSIQVTGTDGCTATSLPIHTTIYDLPVPQIANTQGDSLCVTNGIYFHYQWYNNGQQIGGATFSCYEPTGDGSYSVAVTDEFGCSKMSFPMEISNVGVNNIGAKAAIRVYPNPVTNVVHVDAPVKVSLSVSSLDGRVVYYEQNVHAMDISGLAAGVYVMTVYDLNNTVLKIEKLVKE